ncbi:MAG TPA: DUF742 domain-containing protein [Streptosporangiaceae bacterium]|nr:DUF742 domain-containing protein [Streptosporangiaceae bacterium]
MSSGDYRDRPVRRYVLTGGRAAPTRNAIRPETLVTAVPSGRSLPVSASREERALLGICRRLLSLAEAAVHLDLPVSVVVVVASDLVDSGYLSVRSPAPPAVSRAVLEELLNGLRKLC